MFSVELLVVYTHADCGVRFHRWSGDDDPLRSRRKMFTCTCAIPENSGALHHNVHAKIGPRQFAGVADGACRDHFSIDFDAAASMEKKKQEGYF